MDRLSFFASEIIVNRILIVSIVVNKIFGKNIIIIIIICRLDKDRDQELSEMLSIQLFRIASGQRSV